MRARKYISGLIALLFVLSLHQPGQCIVISSSNAERDSEVKTIEPKGVEIPTWQDLGMDHPMIAGQSTTVSPPSSMRLTSHTPSAIRSTIQANHHSGTLQIIAQSKLRTRVTTGYIYLISCLRL